MKSISAGNFKTTTNYGLTVSAADKRNYYQAMNKKKLEKLYATLPEINCKKKCGDFCGAIPVGPGEEDYISEKYGDENIPEPDDDLRCSQLTDGGRCSIHDRRPIICRLWGLIDNPKMRCPHGCKPERWVTDKEAHRLMDVIIKGEDIDIPTGKSKSGFMEKVRGQNDT